MKISNLKSSLIVTLCSLSLFAQDLKVASGAKLYISPNSFVYVSDNSSIDANGELIMDSVSDDFSDFYVEGTSQGIAEYRHFTASADTRDLVSPPVSGQAFSAFATANNGKIPTGTITGSPNLLYGPLMNSISNYAEYPASNSTPLAAAKGYRAASVGGQTLSYKGIVSTSDISTPLTYGTGRYRHNNLVGNPFTTHLKTRDIAGLLASNSGIDPDYRALYFYTGSTGSFPWEIHNNLTSSTELITPGQGFIVISSPSGGSFSFPKSARKVSQTAYDNAIQGRRSSITTSSFKLRLHKGSIHHDAMLFFVNPHGSRGLDEGYDAGGLPGVSVGTHLIEGSEGVNFSIQALAVSDLTATDYVIPVEVNLAAGEEGTLSILDLDVPAGVHFYLDDTELNTLTRLTTDNYTFTPDTDLQGTGRFYLQASPDTFFAETMALNSVEVFSIASAKKLIVQGQLRSDAILKIFDTRGRLINSYQLESNQTKHSIDVSDVSSGVYIVNLSNKSQSKRTKLVIN